MSSLPAPRDTDIGTPVSASAGTPVGAFQWDHARGTLWCSDELCAILAQPSGAVTTREELLALLVPEDLAPIRERLAGLPADARAYRLRYGVLRPGGDVRHVEERASLTPGGTWVGTLVDLTHEEGSVAALTASRDRLQATWDSQFDPFALLEAVRDEHGAIVDLRWVEANRAAVDYHHTTREGLLGTTVLASYPGLLAHGPLGHYLETAESGTPTVLDDYAYDNEVLGQARRYDIRAVRVGDGIALTWRDVTDRHNAARALARSQENFRLLAENASDIVFQLDAHDRIEWISPSVTELLGWTPGQLLGQRPANLAHPEDRQRLDPLAAADREEAEVRVRTRSGDFHWLAVTTRLLLDAQGRRVGRVGSWRDIESQVAGREALRASEELFRTAMRSAAIGMALVAPGGRFWVVNDSLRKLLQRTSAWFDQHTLAELDHPEDAEMAAYERGLLRVGGDPVVSETRLVRADAQTVWVRQSGVLLAPTASEPELMLLQFQDVTAERTAREELAYRAFHDSLTGLRNRSWLMDILEADLQAAARSRTLVASLFLDIDNFKLVNDSLGHSAGDQVLATVAHRLAECLRPSDRLARFGGDEFVVLLTEISDPREVDRMAARLHAVLATEQVVLGHRIVPTASMGIALSTATTTPESLLRDSESALHQAKRHGRGRWRFADRAQHERAMARLTTEDGLRQALERDEFVVHFQPIVNLVDGGVTGHEALVRWNHPARGLLGPAAFLDVAEDSGLILEIGDRVLAQVCARIARGGDSGPISVNVSGVELARPDWLAHFADRVADHGADPRLLVVEVTETAILSVGPGTQRHFAGLREMGVGIHVDDFGTGYSSLALLQDVPATGIKLDSRFVRDLQLAGGARNAIATGLWVMARELGLTGVAEGVETAEQATVLLQEGWPQGQGYYYARPGPWQGGDDTSAQGAPTRVVRV